MARNQKKKRKILKPKNQKRHSESFEDRIFYNGFIFYAACDIEPNITNSILSDLDLDTFNLN